MMAIRRIIDAFKRLARSSRGTLSVELAMAVPVLTAMVLLATEVTRYVMLNQKVDRASATLADLVAQSEALRETDIADLFQVTGEVLTPFETGDHVRVFISSVVDDANGPKIAWQRSWGSLAASSTYGTEGAGAVLPDGLIVREGDSMIATEVYYAFVPVFAPESIARSTFSKRAVFRPRFATLSRVEPG